MVFRLFFFFQAEDGIRDYKVTGVQTCALPISPVAKTEVGRSDWLELKTWLADVLACGATPAVALKARDDADSLAALDPDVLATLHGVFYRWSVELGIDTDDGKGRAAFAALFRRMRTWQERAADRGAGAAWSDP